LVKLLVKQRITSKAVGHYHSPETPYQGSMDSKDIQDAIKRALTEQTEKLNPFHLRKAMVQKLKKIFQVRSKNSR